MAEREYRPFRVLRIKKGDDLKTIYAKVKRSFTAADVQRYTEDEEMEPAEQVLAELKAIHWEELQKLKQKLTRKRSKPQQGGSYTEKRSRAGSSCGSGK